MHYAARTERGRRENNEDAYLILDQQKLFAVADGVGGYRSGEIASSTAVKEIRKYVEEHPLDDRSGADTEEYFDEMIRTVNDVVIRKAESSDRCRGMATTLVIAGLTGNTLHIANVGDSRAYLYHDGSLEQITVDHTYVNTLVMAGIITEEEAKVHENKNMITRAVGADHNVEVDYFRETVVPGDVLLLCTDGLYDTLRREQIAAEVTCGRTLEETCRELTKLASLKGSNDNITLICAEIAEDDIHE